MLERVSFLSRKKSTTYMTRYDVRVPSRVRQWVLLALNDDMTAKSLPEIIKELVDRLMEWYKAWSPPPE